MTFKRPESGEREADRQRKSRARAATRDIIIPACANPRRRRQCAKDPERFCRTYLADMFSDPFTADTREMLLTIVRCVESHGLYAIAGPRGCGKTTGGKGAIVYLLSYGLASFPVLIGKNADEGEVRLTEIKDVFESNELMAADFPEICTPIRALEGWASRGRLQTVAGVRTRIKWSGRYVIFPIVPGSPASGAILMALGKEASIRGQNIRSKRPDLAVVDDIEDRNSAKSPTETDTILHIITEDVAGLAGPGAFLPIVYPCTIIRRGCVADQLTDRTKNPAWHGRRFKAITTEPDEAPLWERYRELRQRGQFAGDFTAREAHRFYLANRAAMDAGFEVSNPYNYDATPQPDGTTMEASALQHWQNFISDHGREAFDTEYQNAPPDQTAARDTGLTLFAIMGRTNGLPRGVVPSGAELITAAIDVHGRHLTWAVLAFVRGRAHIIDYGADPVASPLIGRITAPENTAAVDAAILAALLAWRDRFADNGWPDAETGEVRPLSLAMVDAGWHPTPVKEFCRDGGRGLFLPAKGFGTGNGQSKYRRPTKKGHGRRLGPHYFATRDPLARVWLHNLDADNFKLAVHSGFQLPPGLAGSITIFGDDPVKHRHYADQIMAEMLIEEFTPGKGMVRRWDMRSRHNHFLDATANSFAAAEILGLRTVTSETAAAMVAESAAQDEAAEAEAETATAGSTKPAAKRKPTPKPPPKPPASGPRPGRMPITYGQPKKRSLAALQAARRR